MAFVIADRVRETTTTTGTGNLTLDGAVSKFRTFASVLSSSDTTYYSIVEQTGTAWEVGIGTFTSPATLARTTILSSSSGGSAVNFGAGTKDVFISLPASKTNTNDQPNVISVNSTSNALRITQTGTGNALVVEDSANPDSSPFVVDASGNVGIGTSSPGNRLDIVSVGSSQIRVKDGVNATAYYDFGRDNTDGFFGFSGAQTTFSGYKWSVNAGSEVMRITNGGNVGIGTSSPGSKLEVNQGILTINTTDQSLTRLELKTTGTGGRTWNIVGGLPGVNNSQFSIYDVTAAATRMTINSSGNVGIGTTSPTQRFDVRGGDGTGGISGSGGTWAAQVIMNQDASGYGGLSVQNRWANSNTAIFEVAKGWNGSAAGYYPVFQILGNATFAAAITDGNSTYPAFFTRSWVNFNGTGTVAIRASGNVTSITDNGTGDYTVNFTTAMPDANYGFAISGIQGTSSFLADVVTGGIAAGTLRINTRRADTRASDDISVVAVSIFR